MACGVDGWPAKSFLILTGGNGKLPCLTWIDASVHLSVCPSVMQGNIDTYVGIKIRASSLLMSERWTKREINSGGGKVPPVPCCIPTKFLPYTHGVWAGGTEVVPALVIILGDKCVTLLILVART